jgi:hypothetical protein
MIGRGFSYSSVLSGAIRVYPLNETLTTEI